MANFQAFIPDRMAEGAKGFRYSPAVRVGDVVHLAGHVGWDDKGELPESAPDQARQTFENIAYTLRHAGLSWSDVFEMTTYHVGLQEQFADFAKIREEYVVAEPYPAWTALGVAELARPALLVEITVKARSTD
jgi:enamine deaminase RidA (YjgF/YER057c/UK114 family)